jgi:hypothetical protein
MNHPPLTDQQQAWKLLAHADHVMQEMFGVPPKPLVLPYGDGTANPIMDDDEGEKA